MRFLMQVQKLIGQLFGLVTFQAAIAGLIGAYFGGTYFGVDSLGAYEFMAGAMALVVIWRARYHLGYTKPEKAPRS